MLDKFLIKMIEMKVRKVEGLYNCENFAIRLDILPDRSNRLSAQRVDIAWTFEGLNPNEYEKIVRTEWYFDNAIIALDELIKANGDIDFYLENWGARMEEFDPKYIYHDTRL
jgi:hypothetical protein